MTTHSKTESIVTRNTLMGLVIGVTIGIGIGYISFSKVENSSSVKVNPYSEMGKEINEEHYQYLNPSIALLDLSSTDITAIEGLDSLLIKQTQLAQKSGKISSAAIYFRDLTTNQKIEVNGKEIFSPGSLMKVPIMIAILKYAEKNPHILEQKLTYKISKEAEYLELSNKNVRSSSKLINGSEYTLAQLVDIMIVESDNEATILLIDFIEEESPQFLNKVEKELGMIVPDEIDFNENFLTIRTYASFFRVLYNSSYLEKKYSEMALEILSKTGYGYGIRQTIPKDVVVAHKYGVKPSKDNFMQLHHFGIVYHQKKPFLIGIMTKGKDMEKLKSFNADITSIVYHRMDERSMKINEIGYKKDIED